MRLWLAQARVRRGRGGGRVIAGVLGASIAVLLNATVALACYGANEGAYSEFTGTTGARGASSNVNLSSATASPGTAIVHPLQIAANDGDFVGWGTYKGRAPTAGNCLDDYSGWNLYVDGASNGVYFCRSSYGALPDNPSFHNFRINYTTCPSSGRTRWVFSINEQAQTCNDMGGHQYGVTAAGGENVYTYTNQRIDVLYADLTWRSPTAGWLRWTNSQRMCQDPGYLANYPDYSVPSTITVELLP